MSASEDRKLMAIEAYVMDGAGQPKLLKRTTVDPIALMVMAESREELVRSKGQQFAQGAVPHFGAELIEAVSNNLPAKDLERIAINVAMSAWLADSIYGGLSAEAFAKSDLRFTMYPGGAVAYQRVLAGALSN